MSLHVTAVPSAAGMIVPSAKNCAAESGFDGVHQPLTGQCSPVRGSISAELPAMLRAALVSVRFFNLSSNVR